MVRGGESVGTHRKKIELSQAEQADRHELYEASVQNVSEECSLVDFVYTQVRGSAAQGMREDFCGTASAACEWVSLDETRYAFGVDLDPEVLAWGEAHNLKALTQAQRRRIALFEGDVLATDLPKVDVIVAFNFSYWIFTERATLLRYFRSVHSSLNSKGMFFLDAYGGVDATKIGKEKTKLDGFTYIWDQAEYSPVSGHMKTHIHFKFPDGSRLEKAFSYDWRVWNLPEITDLLLEAGFLNPTVWFELRDEDGQGLGEWMPDATGPEDGMWVVNITAEK